jgi:hypothetical protein
MAAEIATTASITIQPIVRYSIRMAGRSSEYGLPLQVATPHRSAGTKDDAVPTANQIRLACPPNRDINWIMLDALRLI